MAELDNRIASLVGTLHNMAEDRALREATRSLIAPLVERSTASRALKDKALTRPPSGVHPSDLPDWTAEEIAQHVAGFVEDGKLVLNERGAYDLGEKPEPSVKEALRYANTILSEAGWPDDLAFSILVVFKPEPEDEDEDKE